MTILNIEQQLTNQLLKFGAHFGHRYNKWNPKMKPFIFGIRHNIHIINLKKTIEAIIIANNVINQVIKNDGVILFVGTRIDMAPSIKLVAQKTSQYYVTRKWVGGILTNWDIIKQNFNLKLQASRKNYFYAFSNLRKQDKKIDNLYSGIRFLENKPDLIIVSDVKSTKYCLLEAKLLNIPVIGFIDTTNDPTNVSYPIPINDDSVPLTHFILNFFANTINLAKK